MSMTKLLAEVDWKLAVPAAGIAVGLLGTWWTHQQRATFDMIDGIYALCQNLHARLLTDWRLGHLFCITPAVYYETRDRIAEASKNENRAELIAKERLFVTQLFISYEQAYYQWRRSSVLLPRRRAFLRDMLRYFTERLLRNPRLLAYLESDPSGRSLHLERESTAFLLRQIRLQPRIDPDPVGPFDFPLQAVSV